MRLCTATEWQTACEGPSRRRPRPTGRSRSTRTAYVTGVCNDIDGTGALWVTGFDNGKAQQSLHRLVERRRDPPENSNRVYDMSGNLVEWTVDHRVAAA